MVPHREPRADLDDVLRQRALGLRTALQSRSTIRRRKLRRPRIPRHVHRGRGDRQVVRDDDDEDESDAEDTVEDKGWVRD